MIHRLGRPARLALVSVSQYFQCDWDARKTAGTFSQHIASSATAPPPATSYWGPRLRSTGVHFAPKRWPPRHLSGSA
jgi:hypothetical protein